MTEPAPLAEQAADLIEPLLPDFLRYIAEHRDADTPVVRYRSPEDLAATMDFRLPDEPRSNQEIADWARQYLRYGVRTGHPGFVNQLFSGFSPHAWLGEVVAGLTNTSLYTYEVAPVATLVEQALIREMARLVGFPSGGGGFATGGTNANYLAMLCARNHFFPQAKDEGLPATRLAAFVSDQAHYSFERAMDTLGLGRAGLVRVASDDEGAMRPEALEQSIQASITAGRQPFFVAATAGTTVTGAFDPIPALGEIARRHRLWFHVDGAFGGSVIFSATHQKWLAGRETADSFTWDAHKMLGAGLTCSLLLLRDPKMLTQTCAVSGTEYLFHGEEGREACFDQGLNSLQCGRRVDALRLWFVWWHHGTRGLGERIDQLFALARHAEQRILAEPRLELSVPLTSVNVCFRYRPTRHRDPDEFHRQARETLRREGKHLINYSLWRERTLLRLTLVNFDLTPHDIDRFFDDFLAVAEALDRA